MSEAKHTPLPWFSEPCFDERKNGATCWCACIVTKPGSDDMDDCVCQYGSLTKANAEFIVRACNSHYDLLEACEAALANLIDRDCEDGETGEALRAAIAKARGDQTTTDGGTPCLASSVAELDEAIGEQTPLAARESGGAT